ncbi:hypothetical protein D3C73_1257780 [compost metagenome]
MVVEPTVYAVIRPLVTVATLLSPEVQVAVLVTSEEEPLPATAVKAICFVPLTCRNTLSESAISLLTVPTSTSSVVSRVP